MRYLQMENCFLEFMKLHVNFVPLTRVNPSLDLRGTPPNSLHVYWLRIRRSAELRAVWRWIFFQPCRLLSFRLRRTEKQKLHRRWRCHVSAPQIEVLSQYLIGKDEEFKGLTSKNTELSQDLTNLRSEFYESQKQLQRQEQIHIESHQQVSNHYLTMWDLLDTLWPLKTK